MVDFSNYTDAVPHVTIEDDIIPMWSYRTITGKLISLPEFEDDFFKNQYAVIKRNGKYGAIDKENKIIIPIEYDSVNIDRDGRSVVCIHNSNSSFSGMYNHWGKLCIPCTYDMIYIGDNLNLAITDDKSSYFDDNGNLIIALNNVIARRFSESLAGVYKKVNGKNKIGYINEQGELVIDHQFDFGWYFKEGIAIVGNNGNFGYISNTGKLICPIQYSYCSDFNSGIAVVGIKNKYGLINRNGDQITEIKYDTLSDFRYSRSYFTIDNKKGYVDINGKEFYYEK